METGSELLLHIPEPMALVTVHSAFSQQDNRAMTTILSIGCIFILHEIGGKCVVGYQTLITHSELGSSWLDEVGRYEKKWGHGQWSRLDQKLCQMRKEVRRRRRWREEGPVPPAAAFSGLQQSPAFCEWKPKSWSFLCLQPTADTLSHHKLHDPGCKTKSNKPALPAG